MIIRNAALLAKATQIVEDMPHPITTSDGRRKLRDDIYDALVIVRRQAEADMRDKAAKAFPDEHLNSRLWIRSRIRELPISKENESE